MTAPTAALKQFWKQQEKLGQLKGPLFKTFKWQDELPIPWVIHGDGAPYSEIDSLRVISMRCLLTNVQVEHSQFMLACLSKCLGSSGWVAIRHVPAGLESPSQSYLPALLDPPLVHQASNFAYFLEAFVEKVGSLFGEAGTRRWCEKRYSYGSGG